MRKAVGFDFSPHTLRHTFATLMLEGTFVQEAYLALIASGRFRNADGTTDKQAVAESMRGDRATADAWARKLASMERDGSLARLAAAINSAVSYADGHALRFKPVQVRQGLFHLAACVSATAAALPDLYADACNRTMTWMGERPHPDAATVRFRLPVSGEAGRSLAAVRWDPAYAKEVYGPVFTDVQAKANDQFWKVHFELYADTASFPWTRRPCWRLRRERPSTPGRRGPGTR